MMKTSMRRALIGAMTACVLAAGVTTPRAADAPAAALIPVEDFARQPNLRSVSFSPDGQRFAAVRQIAGRMNLVTGDLKSNKLTQVTSFSGYDVSSYNWMSNDRLVFSVYDSTKGLVEQRGGGPFAVNWDGSERRDLSTSANRRVRFLRRIPGNADEIIAVMYERDIQTADVYRLNTKTGRKTLLTEDNPGKVSRWVLDKDNVPRAALSSDGKALTETFWYRDTATSPWRKIGVYGTFEKSMSPATFDADGTLYVYTNLNSDKDEVHAFDAAKGAPGEPLIKHPLVDASTGSPIKNVAGKLLGWRVDADLPETAWFEDGFAKTQALLDRSLPAGNRNSIELLEDGRMLVQSYSERDPSTFYLYDPVKKSLEELLRPTDWLKPERMGKTQVVRYKARDGLEIPSYLTLPAGKDPKKLPLVAWIHGGPWARDHWGYSPDVQFLASRGYAVWQPNYRGSTGFGMKHLQAGYKQLGQAMQDDITDGIKHLIAQGIVDAERVCIGGGSYGGYATVMGLIKEPQMFRCGIDEVGVMDLIWWQELAYTDFNQADSEGSEKYLKVVVGDVKADREMMEKYSPRFRAQEIKAPVLIIHGAGDRRVPIRHAEAIRDALQSNGKTYEWVVYSEEGHGYTKPENRIDRYKKIEAFLGKYLKP